MQRLPPILHSVVAEAIVAGSAEGTSRAIAVDELALLQRLVSARSDNHEVRLRLLSEAVSSLARFGLLGSASLLDILGSLIMTLDLHEGLAAFDSVRVLRALLDFLVSMVPVESLNELLELVLSLGGIESLALALGADGAGDTVASAIGACDLEVFRGETSLGRITAGRGASFGTAARISLGHNGAGEHGQRQNLGKPHL